MRAQPAPRVDIRGWPKTIPVSFDEDARIEIEKFRVAHDIPSRGEAIRILVEMSLTSDPITVYERERVKGIVRQAHYAAMQAVGQAIKDLVRLNDEAVRLNTQLRQGESANGGL